MSDDQPGPRFGPLDPSIGHDVFFQKVEIDAPADRDSEDIMLRRVPRSIAHRFRGAAGARGMTHAQYLAALVNLHEIARQRVDSGDGELAAILDDLGLRTVSI